MPPMVRLWLLLFVVSSVTISSSYGDNTDWGSLSPSLLSQWQEYLPPLPSEPMDVTSWVENESTGSVFQRVILDLSAAVMCPNVTAGGSYSASWPSHNVVTAGPKLDCGVSGGCNAGRDASWCKATGTLNNLENIVALSSKHGTFYARQNAQPAWVQFRFPVPDGAHGVNFRFKMDERYRPVTRGGNPCGSNSNCSLCTTKLVGGVWDHNVPAGVFVLWSTPGANRHIISPTPIDVGLAHDRDDYVVGVESPSSLSLSNTPEVVITLFVFNQYPFAGELVDGVNGYSLSNPTRCSTSWTKVSGESDSGNILLSVTSAEIVTSSKWEPSSEPAMERPRLFGADASWFTKFVKPFEDAPCKHTSAFSPGWGGKAGFPDMKGVFQAATNGFASCYTFGVSSEPPATIQEHSSVKRSYADPDFRSNQGNSQYNVALQSLHLVRRLRACHRGDIAGPCQFNLTETHWLEQAILSREFDTFNPTTRASGTSSWGWEQDSDGCCGFDLYTPVPLKLFALIYDILGTEADAYNLAISTQIKEKMESYIDLFIQSFDDGDWNLWNGNNWTPVLSSGAAYWAIAFWHENPGKASRVMHMVNDINVLHKGEYVEDGTYKEGVCQYSYMSISHLLTISVLYAQSFNEAWPAIEADALRRTATWQLDSFDVTGHALNFGDSHGCRGTVPTTLHALFAPALMAPDIANATASLDVSPCLLRAWSTFAYFVSVDNVWHFWPELVLKDFERIMGDCKEDGESPGAEIGHIPLGPTRMKIYSAGGFGMIRSPLLQNCSHVDDQTRWKCTLNETGLPSLAHAGLYSQFSMEARPNRWSHSEVDFATIKWSAYGASLISEFGYGTIATAVSQWDMRRYGQVDNVPSGHNTLVIREASSPTLGPGVFSQLQFESGTIKAMETALKCTEMDGSKVYGSTRPDGWLDYMHRWVCEVGLGHFMMIDAFAVKEGRSRMYIYGSQYGGPSFNESTLHSSLTIDEYFHTPHGLSGTELPTSGNYEFVRGDGPRWCQHTDVELDVNDTSSVHLTSRCGFALDYADGDAVGRITSWSSNGGRMIVDSGVVSATDSWGVPKYHLNRFRYVGNSQTTTEGDVRAFMFTAGHLPDFAIMSWISQCTSGEYMCIEACVDETLYEWKLSRTNRQVQLMTGETVGKCDATTRGSSLRFSATSTESTTATTTTADFAEESSGSTDLAAWNYGLIAGLLSIILVVAGLLIRRKRRERLRLSPMSSGTDL